MQRLSSRCAWQLLVSLRSLARNVRLYSTSQIRTPTAVSHARLKAGITADAHWCGPALRRWMSTTGRKPSDVFADHQSAEFLAAAATSASIPKLHGRPEVIVTGRANVGKSTLLNAVLGRRNLLHTSKTPGRTQTLNFYRVGPPPGQLVLVDAPGYGARGRPEWGALFEHYLQTRAELRRVLVLIHAAHGLNAADRMMLASLDAHCQSLHSSHSSHSPQPSQSHSPRSSRSPGPPGQWTLQAIITKADTLRPRDLAPALARIRADLFSAAPTCLPPIVTAAAAHDQLRLGVDEVRASIAEACGLGRVEAKVFSTRSAGASAGAGAGPVRPP
ncbi:P-loop containing nucleoside triphosphate hydrolase protein [Earliella scabrosa]|nr:P-loop containing nucleoside triphosphate hydrolase protein [Earliella scabrosa]